MNNFFISISNQCLLNPTHPFTNPHPVSTLQDLEAVSEWKKWIKNNNCKIYKTSLSIQANSPEKSQWWQVIQLCLTLFDPMDCNIPGSSVHVIFQARVLEWVAISFSNTSQQPIEVPKQGRKELLTLSVDLFYGGKLFKLKYSWCTVFISCSVTKSYPTLCDPMDCSPPGSSVHVISQSRILRWVAISSSRGSSQSRNL